MPLENDLDVKQSRFAERVRRAVRDDARRIVIVGARGWIGRTAVALLLEALGADTFAARVSCFGSSEGIVRVGAIDVPQRALSDLATLDSRPTLLFHLAFLTMDKFGTMDADDYVEGNRALSRTVLAGLEPIGVDRLFVASSGAAAFANDASAADNLRCYGRLKLDDEALFAGWVEAADSRRAAIARIYSVSGPHINKHQTYALASLILAALANQPIEVHAPMRVIRSYVAVRDLLSLVFAALLAPEGDRVLRFDTGGEALELGDVAASVARSLGGTVLRRPISEPRENRYVGDASSWAALLARFELTELPLDRQIAETAAWLARQTEPTT